MRQSLWKTLLWQVVGFLFYLAGMVLFVVVAVSAFLAPPENSLANLSTGDLAVIGVSVALLVVGRVITWKRGGETAMAFGSIGGIRDRGPKQSRLEELGYQMPSEPSDDSGGNVTYEDGTVYIQCTECGTKNEQEFSYCSNCSAELPE